MNKEKELKKLGETVRTARIKNGMSQADLANQIGKDQQSIQRLEAGKINPSYIYLLEVAAGLQIDLFELLK